MPVGCLPECPRAKMLYTVSCPRCVELRACELAAAICIGTLEDGAHTVAVVSFEVVM